MRDTLPEGGHATVTAPADAGRSCAVVAQSIVPGAPLRSKVKLPCHDANSLLATPWREEAPYAARPASMTTVTAPPRAGVRTPAWTAAGQIAESSV